jgi:diguanylate cyclase (GGDEF)-like protein/PAS domain S-box-containing protein
MGGTTPAGPRAGGPPSRWWFALGVAGLLVAVQGWVPSPTAGFVRSVAFTLAAAAATVGLRRNDPPHRRAWTAIVAGLWVGAAAQLAWSVVAPGHDVARDGPFAIVGGVADGVAFALLLVGFLVLTTAGQRTLLRQARLVDTAIVAFATGFLVVELVAEWALQGDQRSSAVWAGLTDVVLAVAVAFAALPVVVGRRGRPATALAGLSLLLLVATDVLFVVDRAAGVDLHWTTALGAAMVTGAAAMLHPSMRRIGTGTPRTDQPLTGRTFAVSGLALILPPLVLGVADVVAPGQVASASELAVFLVGIAALLNVRTNLLIKEGRRADDRFRQYFDLPLIGMVITGPDGRTLEVNERLCEMLGRSRDDVLELGLRAFVHPGDLDPEDARVGRLTAGDVPSLVGDRRYLRADGTTMYARGTDHAVLDEDGRVDYVIGLVEDVTEAHLAEERMAAHLALQDVVLQVAERFVNIDTSEVDRALDDALAALGRQCRADIAFLLERHGTSITTTHHWRARPEDEPVELALSVHDQRPSLVALREGRVVVIDSIDRLAVGWEREAALMRHNHAHSAVLLPLVAEDVVLGSIGLTRREPGDRWTPETVELLKLAAEVVTQALIGRRTARALAESEARNRSVVEAAADGIVTVDHRGEIRTFNPAAEALTGWMAAEVVGRPAALLVADSGQQLIAERLRESVERGEKLEVEGLRRDGTHFPLELTMSPVLLPDGPAFTVIARDVADRRRLEAQLIHQALHDPLTGLANRTLLLDRIGSALRRAERTGTPPLILFIDLDRFKVINDSLGHDVGDELLMVVAHRLEGELRAGDTAARLGGDEFVVLCEGIETPELAEALAARILDAVSRPVELDRARPVITASIGIVRADADSTPEALLRDADASMYRAKESGRNRMHHFDSSVHGAAVERLQLEAGLRQALAGGELCLHLQPQYAIGDLRPVGAEALLRWDRPGEGLVAPTRFLAVAEEIGLDVEIDRWVLREAVRLARDCVATNPDFVVWVNLSARLLADPVLPELFLATAADVAPSNLGIEITERALVRDLDTAARSLDRLRKAGVHIAIDDFGTGFSSLSWLERLPIDVLKIDRSFTSGLGTSGDDTVIVRSVIAMAHSLGLLALAEGVETPEQLRHLHRLGCDYFQGFLAAEPRPAHEVRADRPAELATSR